MPCPSPVRSAVHRCAASARPLGFGLLGCLAASVFLAGCGGGDGGESTAVDASPAPAPMPAPPPPPPPPAPSPPPPPPPPAAPGGLYIGWLEEDPLGNPEDPTVGALFLRVPASDGAYSGVMPFGYVGCSPGVDIGSTTGTRSGGGLAGTWSGTLDGVGVGGSFTAQAETGSTPVRFDGSFSSAGGKQAIGVGACSYFLAAQGRFRVFDGPASEPAGVALAFSDSGTTPVISWTGVPAGATTALRLFDQACLQGPSPGASCYLGEAFSTGSRLAYPAAFSGARPLAVGGDYVAVLTAQTATSGTGAGIAAFASARFSPTVDSDDGGGPGPGTGLGELALTGSLGAVRFTPNFLSGPETDGPRCFGSDGATVCSSSWTTQWLQQGDPLSTPLVAGLLVSVGSSSLGAPGPAPGSSLDLLTVRYTDVASSRIFQFSCGTTPSAPCSAATPGVTLDLQARTLRLQDSVLPAAAPSTGSITLTGTLSF